jgi:putative photosynthetic complex assembly protein
MTHPAETAAPRSPGLRRHDSNDMVPVGLLRAMLALALVSLALVSYAVATDRPRVAVPPPADILAERLLILEGRGAQAVVVRAADGSLIADMAHGGFITVIQNGLQRERLVHGIDPLLPVRLVHYANNRLAVHDPHTGWSVELGNFGADNRAAFARLLPGA